MEQYISKSAVLELIKKRYEYWREKEHSSHSIESEARMSECQHLLLLLNTLAVKTVDLDFTTFCKEMDEVFALPSEVTKNTDDNPLNWEYAIAKHFFELGLSVNNPITAADRGIADEIIFALKTLGEEKMISYDKEIEWLSNKAQKGE